MMNKLADIQFIFLKEISDVGDGHVIDTISTIKRALYKSEEAIQTHLMKLADNIEKRNTEDILLLNLKYIIEILNGLHPEVERILLRPKIREYVFAKIFKIRESSLLQSYISDDGDKGKILCAKFRYKLPYKESIGFLLRRIHLPCWH